MITADSRIQGEVTVLVLVYKKEKLNVVIMIQ